MSLNATGTPRSGKEARPGSSAARRAASRSSATKAPISFSRAAIALAQSSTTRAGLQFAGLDAAGKIERGKHQPLRSMGAARRRPA